MVKKLLFVLAGLLVLLIVAGVVAWISINAIAKKGVEAGGTYALGVKTTLGSASVGLLSGTFGMSKLNVANPEGFPGDHFFSLGQGSVAVSLASLTKDTIVVPHFTLDTIDVRLDRKDGKSNYKVILDNLKKLQGEEKSGKAPPEGPGKKFVIKEVTIRKIKVHVDPLAESTPLGDAGLSTGTITIPIEEIRLTNVGSGNGASMSQIASTVVQAVLAAAVENGGGLIPADIAGDLRGALAGLDGLEDVGMGVVKDVGGQVEKLGGELGKGLEDAAKEGEKAIEKLGDQIGDIFGDKKK